MPELDPFLNAQSSLRNSGTSVTGFQFDVENERGAVGNMAIRNAAITTAKIGTAQITNAQIATAAIGTANIGTLSFNEIYGGTATLGGTSNGNGRLIMKDQSGNTFLTLDASGMNGTSTGTIAATGAFSQRHYITLIEAGAETGAQISYYTDSSNPQGLDASRVMLDPASFPSNKFYLEAVYRAGTTGQTARRFFMDFYDITGGSVVANGTFTGTTQSGTGYGVYPRERSLVDFRPSMAVGSREYMLRYWGTSTPGTLFVDLYAARLIIEY